jgi:hypothetical protein
VNSRCMETIDFVVEDLADFKPGRVPEEYLNGLYYFMRPSSDNVKKAVIKHLCFGALQSTAAEEFEVKQGNISRQVRRLE